MQEQDEDVDVLAGAVRRQKELGIQIQQELEVQKDLLGLLDEDVGRVGGRWMWHGRGLGRSHDARGLLTYWQLGFGSWGGSRKTKQLSVVGLRNKNRIPCIGV